MAQLFVMKIKNKNVIFYMTNVVWLDLLILDMWKISQNIDFDELLVFCVAAVLKFTTLLSH